MILRNHGLLTCGATVGEAFMLMYYLERSCRTQMQVLASGQEYTVPPDDVCAAAAGQYEIFPHGKYEWPALLRMLEQQQPGYKD
jgi:ribulose-5-phosphate 4-epimerase/fuculose-1-phosphate aldolase